jgi:glycosyltransferase involved in cell wall biosynthesis
MIGFSVVVPTYRRPESLEGLIDALARQTYPSSLFEVVVIDDGGDIPLESIMSRYRPRLNLTLLWQSRAGPAAARNYGARYAVGRRLAFTDDDCLPEPGWLQELREALGECSHILCGGKVVNALPRNVYCEASQMLAEYLCAHYSPTVVSGGFFPSNNMALSREAFWQAGGFDPSLRFGEDRDLCYRWAALGHSFVFVPGAVVRHAHPQGLWSFLRLHAQYGRGTFHFRAGSAKKGLAPVGISSPLWYLNLLLYGIRREPGLKGMKLSFLLAAAQAAGAAGMAGAWRASRFASDP